MMFAALSWGAGMTGVFAKNTMRRLQTPLTISLMPTDTYQGNSSLPL